MYSHTEYSNVATINKHSECITELASISTKLNGMAKIRALLDTGSSDTFINKSLCDSKHNILPSNKRVSMADLSLSCQLIGKVSTNFTLFGMKYFNINFLFIPNSCEQIILSRDCLQLHKSLYTNCGGKKGSLKICSLNSITMKASILFPFLSPECKPIASPSRRYNAEDKALIEQETKKLLELDIIEPSNSPWRSQIVVTRNERHKKRMIIDYSQTINCFTLIDAYPLPNINELVNFIAKYSLFRTIDLIIAYLQIPLLETSMKAMSMFNEEKSILSTSCITFQGFIIKSGSFSPDPDCLKSLIEIPATTDNASLRQALALQAIDESISFEAETDASDFAIAASLNEAERPVAFFSRKLSPTEKKYSSVEKKLMLLSNHFEN
ncbi:uncharacterized protein LOC136090818 [Hydra vulgaris]|uniref:Uncharacterized protein LOC136090818 n=1 Tax=Hydra vulgaris TaxID=6087 RepID=A0ABM4DHB8_HYDVU